MSDYGYPYYPSQEEHTQREAVLGPYHAVARGEDADTKRIEDAMYVSGDGSRRHGSRNPLTLAGGQVEALERILAAYKADLHVSGAPDRVYSNDATVRAAVDALNRATR